MNQQTLFYNGKWYSADTRPDFLDLEFFAYQHTLHYASAAFEGTRCYPSLLKKDTVNLIGVDWRIDRLFRSIEYMWLKLPADPEKVWGNFLNSFPALAEKYKPLLKGKIKREAVVQFPYTKPQVRDFILKTILLNLHTGFVKPEEGCYVRPVAFRGVTKDRHLGVFSLGHSADFLIGVKPWGKYLGAEAFEKGAPVVVAQEGNEEFNRRHKLACNYLTGQRLVNFAAFNRFNEILLTDATSQRNVLEGSGENLIFYCGNNRFVSPRQENKPILPGTTLKVIDQIIRQTGGEITYRDIPIEEVLAGTFKGAAMTGTAAEVTPLSLVFDPKTRRAVEIPVADEIRALQKIYLDLVQGSAMAPALQTLQKELILEIRWDEKEHTQLIPLIR